MTKFIILLSVLFAFVSSCSKEKSSNELEASGTIEATDVTVSSKTAGQVKELFFDEGGKVKVDEILVMLDHESLDIQLRQAQAGVEQAEAQLRLLQAGARKEDIALAEEQVKLAEINLKQAEINRDRVINLYESNAITKQLYEEGLTRYDQAINQYNTSQENLNKVRNIVRPEEIESAKANLKRSIVNIDLIRKSIDDCTIKSPVDGIVSDKFVEAGEFVTPGSSLLKISDLQNVKLVIYVTEEELGKVKLGQNAEVKIDTYKDKVYSGEVIFISPEAQFTPKNIQTQEERVKLVFAVKIQLPNSQFDLKPGMPADAKLLVTEN